MLNKTKQNKKPCSRGSVLVWKLSGGTRRKSALESQWLCCRRKAQEPSGQEGQEQRKEFEAETSLRTGHVESPGLDYQALSIVRRNVRLIKARDWWISFFWNTGDLVDFI